MPSASQVKGLYKAFLREGEMLYPDIFAAEPISHGSSFHNSCSTAGRKFTNYNVREFVQRKTKADFRSNAKQTDKAVVEQLWLQAKQDLEVAKRQALVYSLYGSKQKSVMVRDRLLTASSC